MGTQEKPTVCFVAIVKNEAHIIRRCIESTLPWVTHYAVVDTGSTDGTQNEIRAAFGDVPGLVVDRPWVDFATNRNQALELGRASGADYLLLLDADEELVGDVAAGLPLLEADAYMMWFSLDGSDTTWARHGLLKASEPWRYEGAIHEYLTHPGKPTLCQIVGVEIASHGDGDRNRVPGAKYAKDIKLLKRKLREDPKNSRAWFYLGQSYSGIKDSDNAIRAFRRRVDLGGWREEVFYSLFQIACHRELRGDHWLDVSRAYQVAYEYRPTRAEPLWALAVLHNDRGEHRLSEMYARAACGTPRPGDGLLVHRSIYEWRCAYELAAALAKQGRGSESREILKRVLDVPTLDDDSRKIVEDNLSELDGA